MLNDNMLITKQKSNITTIADTLNLGQAQSIELQLKKIKKRHIITNLIT